MSEYEGFKCDRCGKDYKAEQKEANITRAKLLLPDNKSADGAFCPPCAFQLRQTNQSFMSGDYSITVGALPADSPKAQ